MPKFAKTAKSRLTPNQKMLLEQLEHSPNGEVVLPFKKAQVVRALFRTGHLPSYTSRNGMWVIQTQAAKDRDPPRPKCTCPPGFTTHADTCPVTPWLLARWSAGTATVTDEPQGALSVSPRRSKPGRSRLNRFEMSLSRAAWHAYIAGMHVAARDDALLKASDTTDRGGRAMYVKIARRRHHQYLLSARSYRKAEGAREDAD